MTIRVARDQLITLESAHLPPAATVAAGDELWIETVRGTTAPFLTGPIDVRGLGEGDSLALTIEEIHVTGRGAIGFAQTKLPWEPWGGVLRQGAGEAVFREVVADDDIVQLSPDVNVPARPMIGWIGLIQREYVADPWEHGGNLDTSCLTTGSTIYLHDSSGSGRFLLGDLHAAMGDGEVSGMGVEIAGEVRLTVDVIDGTRPHRPMICTPATVSHLSSRFLEVEAYAQCVADAAAHLAYSQSISTDEANAWLGAVGDLRVSSVVAHTPTYRMDVPRHLLRPPEELLRTCSRTLLDASARQFDQNR